MLGVISILEDFGIEVVGAVYSDSTAAFGIIQREGLGRTRHIRVQHLWMQQAVHEERMCVAKAPTD